MFKEHSDSYLGALQNLIPLIEGNLKMVANQHGRQLNTEYKSKPWNIKPKLNKMWNQNKNLWGIYLFTSMIQTFSFKRSRSCFLPFSTSSLGPRMRTLSLLLPSGGNLMLTPPHSSMMERMSRPLAPITALWCLCGMLTSIWVTFAWKEELVFKLV